MRWLIMLFLGMALGVGALFTYLRWYGDDGAVSTAAPVATTPATAPAAVPVQPVGEVPAPPPLAPVPSEAVTLPVKEGAEQPAAAPADAGTSAAAGSVTDPNAVAPNADPHLPTGQTGNATPNTKLLLPVEGVKAGQLNDTFNQPRGGERRHEALDIMAPKGAKVLAVADGKVAKLFTSKPGGLTVYQFDPEDKFSYYYAHLDRYAPNLKEGQAIKRGEVIGYVGVTGNSDPNAPHLHFAVFELPPTKEWWKGKPVNPFPLIEK